MTLNFNHINASEQLILGSVTAPLLASNAAVLSVNADSNPNLTGNVQFVSGAHITLSQVGQAITINATGELSTALASSHIFVGNASNIATDTAVTGDVSISNIGLTTVLSVGGSSASNIHNAELAANAATNLNTPSTIVKRDGSSNFSAGTITASLAGHASLDLALTGGTMSGTLDMGQNQILNLVLHKGTSEPVSPAEGQVFYRTDTHQAELWNGTAWVLIG